MFEFTGGQDARSASLWDVYRQSGAPACLSDAQCDDGDACTIDTCDPEAGCQHQPTCLITLARETFESGDWLGGVGWVGTTGWAVTGDTTVVQTGTPHGGVWHAQLRRGTGHMARRFRLKTATAGIHVKFWAKVVSYEAADQAVVQISVDGGPLQTIHTFGPAESDGAYHLVDIDITALATGTPIKLVFDTAGDTVDDVLFIDDIRVTGLH
jgi:hypothetical protein